jgi:hypothetical protein
MHYPGAIMTWEQEEMLREKWYIPTTVSLGQMWNTKDSKGNSIRWCLVGDPLALGTMINDPLGTGRTRKCIILHRRVHNAILHVVFTLIMH